MPVPEYGMVATLALLLGRRLAAVAAAWRACCCCCCWAVDADEDEATRAVEEEAGVPALLPAVEGCSADADDMGGPPPPPAARLSRRSQGLEGEPAVQTRVVWCVAQQTRIGTE